MPAEAPVCARAGVPPMATATAVASATARKAGLIRRRLLGGFSTIILQQSFGPPVRDRGYGWSQLRSTLGRHNATADPPSRNPANAAVPGRRRSMILIVKAN